MSLGAIGKHLMSVRSKGKLTKPSVRIQAYVEDNDYPAIAGGGKAVGPHDYLKKDLKRSKKKLAQLKSALESWVPEDVAARAKKSIEREIAIEEARQLQYKAEMAGYDDEDESTEEEEE